MYVLLCCTTVYHVRTCCHLFYYMLLYSLWWTIVNMYVHIMWVVHPSYMMGSLVLQACPPQQQRAGAGLPVYVMAC